MEYKYGFYYQCLPNDLKREIVEMWVNEGALTLERAEERVDDIVFVGWDLEGKPCCITSVYIDKFDGRNFYFFRMFVKKSERGKLNYKASKLTHEYLKTFKHPLNPAGVIAIAENDKITQRIMKSHAWNYYGKNDLNQDVYYVLF